MFSEKGEGEGNLSFGELISLFSLAKSAYICRRKFRENGIKLGGRTSE